MSEPPRTTRPPSRHLNREILALAVPSFFSTVSVPLLGIADTALVGHLGDVALLGAVAVGSILFDTLYWAFGFLRMGTTALTAQAYGAGDDRRAGEILLQSTGIALLIGIAIVILRVPITNLGLTLAGGSHEVTSWARAYVLVRIMGAPVVLLTFALNGFFRGMKDAVTPLVVTVAVNGLNIALDVVLIYGKLGAPAMGVVGAAWASFIAVLVGGAIALGVLIGHRRYRQPLLKALPGLARRDGVFSPARVRKLASTHWHLFLRTLVLLAAYFLMVATAARLGDVALAANAVVLQLWHLSSYSVDGIAFACETLIGNALGAGDGTLVRKITDRSVRIGVGFGALFSLGYLLALRPIAGMFTPDPWVIDAVVALTAVTVISQPVNAVAFVFDGVFIGANDMRYLFIQMLISFVVAFLPPLFVLVHWLDLGLTGLWTTMFLFMTARTVTLAWRYRQRSWLSERLQAAIH